MSEQVALFPLKTVLMPGCYLDLQIFEARYLDMVSRCFRQQQGFVVVGLEEGSEAFEQPAFQRHWLRGADY